MTMILVVSISGCSSKQHEDVVQSDDMQHELETNQKTDKTSDKDQKEEDKSLGKQQPVMDESKQSNDNPSDSTDKDMEAYVQQTLTSMTIEEKVGQLIMTDFRQYDGKNLTIYHEDIGQKIKDYHIGGIILFRENCTSREQTKQLITDFGKQADIPLMIGIDQEGGLVTRLSFAATMPGNMALGATRDTGLAEEVGQAIGSELEALGIHINFAPDIDVNSNPDNPVIGVRSFGDNEQIVSDMGIAYMKGLNKAGVAAVGKHFPGHGDVALDSHYVLPTSHKTLDELYDIELKPFQKLMDAGLQGVMSAHITFPKVESNTVASKKDGLMVELPATLSSKFLTDVVRHDMEFKGLVFTDAMEMQAITNHFGGVEAAIRAVNAGADVILMPSNLKLVYGGLLKAVNDGRIAMTRINESVERILRFKYEYIINQDKEKIEHIDAATRLEVEQKVANASITVVDNQGMLPIQTTAHDKIAIIGFTGQTIDRMYDAVKVYHPTLEKIHLTKSLNTTGKLVTQQKNQLQGATKVILVTYIANGSDATFQMKLVKDILTYKKDTVVVAARNPYELDEAYEAKALVAQYSKSIASFKGTAQVLFGELDGTGKLPVAID